MYLCRTIDYCTKMGISGIDRCDVGEKVASWDLKGHLEEVHGMNEYSLIPLKLGRKYPRNCDIPAAGSTWDDTFIFHEYKNVIQCHSVTFFLNIRASLGRVSWIPYLMGSKSNCRNYYCKIKLESQQTVRN